MSIDTYDLGNAKGSDIKNYQKNIKYQHGFTRGSLLVLVRVRKRYVVVVNIGIRR